MTRNIEHGAGALTEQDASFLHRAQVAFTRMQSDVYPQIVRVEIGRRGGFLRDIAFVVAMVPDLMMVARPEATRIDLSASGYPELFGRALYDRARQIASDVDRWRARQAAILAEIEPALAAAQQEGLPIRLRHVALFEPHGVRNAENGEFTAVIETLGHTLRAVEQRLSIGPGETFATPLHMRSMLFGPATGRNTLYVSRTRTARLTDLRSTSWPNMVM